jgi:acetylornithine deacetylase/succinyl-diaminopimelate desuccinylase-like protein
VLFGPGGAGLHSVEEYVTLVDVEDCAAVLRDLAVEFCSTEKGPGLNYSARPRE